MPSSDVLASHENEQIPNIPFVSSDEYELSSATSIALSESDTLNEDRSQRLDLQETFNDNFDHYLPFVLRRLRLRSLNETAQPSPDVQDMVDYDDQPTINEEDIYGTRENEVSILGVNPSSLNLKRRFIIAEEFIKGTTYVFPSEDSFARFKELRSAHKKNRKGSVTLFDKVGNPKIVATGSRSKDDEAGEIVDPRNHIIPLDQKLKGVGLPLFKVSVPYFSNFKKNAPYMVFHKYKELPSPPNFDENGDLIDNEFETFQFCTVYTKRYQEVKRYLFEFNCEEPFKVVAFQHCLKPFVDFNYKNTRFRVIGTPVVSTYASVYNPNLKLLIVDSSKPSLCDSIINKKPGFEISSFMKKKNKSKKEDQQEDYSMLAPEEYPNPYPDPGNPLLRDEFSLLYGGLGYSNNREYIPDELPPFGEFKDCLAYKIKMSLIPKKYSEVGRVEVYQVNRNHEFYPDNPNDNYNTNSTKSVTLDNLVINCILMTLRETSVRSTARPSSQSVLLASRIGGYRQSAPGLGAASFGDFTLLS
ncbi:hypothetical protein CANTEDRAFT_108665 [Yamadazyma tenuis ATCC 10573]|uniref:Uncharacterized protein n=2 Tax=Candida tenuis TaxID=2315449 RepID=G3B9T1_CANTC|nr:uncharacterized protein CANTEDRAFT_108665 [Yamadazyma tenuis ATCC 10573]EGV61963.1 hypothetical protein CANTEDRAFT_108665 [Yamadazyma tenuis ATCC 10573]